jgi:hypothetical protein
VTVTPEQDHAAATTETDAVVFSFADPSTELYGLARLGLSGAGESRRGSALAVLFRGRSPVAAIAEGDVEVGAGADWSAVSLPGLGASVDAPLERWSVLMSGERHGFGLTFEAVSPPAELGPDEPAARAGGMAGYEQLCRVRGEVAIDGEVLAVTGGVGQRGRSWGSPDWRRLAAAHTICAWMGPEEGVAVCALHPTGAKGHGEDARWGAVLGAGAATPITDPRVSTTYDGDGRQRRAGLELWIGEGEEEYARRAAGTVLCGSTLELGQLRLDCAFMRWTMGGRSGIGRYDVLRLA